MFDMSKDKWFIAVSSCEEAILLQEWLTGSKGFHWSGLLDSKVRTDIGSWDYPYAIGMGHYGGGSLGQARPDWWLRNGHLEIKVAFKTTKTVEDIIYPIVESDKDKKIKALEETIAKVQSEIQKIKEGM